ncbi:MAG: cyclic nucleotide-binding domain-containing protein [Gammaproteobacteria bacterium]|nr:cyclic nucleotide-binding domain-containing protein [Gammaproteobacteria bacterium]
MNAVTDILTQSSLSKGLTPTEIEQLSAICDDYTYDSGKYIIKENETNRDLYIIYKGLLSIEVCAPSNKSSQGLKIKTIRGTGIVGEFSFIDGQSRSASVVAKNSVQLLHIPYDKLTALMEQNHHIGYCIMQNSAKQICENLRCANYQLRSYLY